MASIRVMDGTVRVATDLNIFKKLKGNRDVSEERVAKIENSAREIGWITPTIIVNEKMEIIDGQGRFEVARRNGLPLYYKTIPGIGVAECIEMNIDQVNWTLEDYCKSYEAQGSDNYARFNRIRAAFPDFAFSVITCAATGSASANNANIKRGKLICSKEQEDLARETLSWLENFKDALKGIPGESTQLYKALIFIYTSIENCDKERLIGVLTNYDFTVNDTFSKINQALKFIEKRYNNRLQATNKIYFEHEYVLVQAAKNPWYEAKWGWRVFDD